MISRSRIISFFKNNYFIFILILLPFIVYWKNWFPFKDRVFYEADALQAFQILYSMAQQLRDGIVPLWDPHTFFGVPLLTRPDSLVFYPPLGFLVLISALLHFSVTTTYVFMQLIFILHLSIAGIGTYLVLRRFNLSPFSSFIGGIIYMLNGNTAIFANAIGLSISMTLLPWTFLAFDKLIHKPLLKNVLFFSLTFAFQLTLFAFQTAIVYQLPLFAMYFLYLVYSKEISFKKPVLGIMTSLVMAILLASVVVLPGLQIPKISERANVNYDLSAFSGNMKPRQLIELGIPYFFSKNYGEIGKIEPLLNDPFGYAGILPLLLVVPALFLFERKAIFFFGAFLFFLLFSIGGETPIFDLLYSTLFPLMKPFVNVAKALHISFFALAIVAAYGLEILLFNMNSVLKKLSMYKKILSVGLVFIIGVFLFFILSVRHELGGLPKDALPLISMLNSVVMPMLIFVLSVFAFYLLALKRELFKVFVFLLIFFDLYLFAMHYRINNSKLDPGRLIANNKAIQYMTSRANNYFERSDITELPHNYAPGVVKINHVDGYLTYRSKTLMPFLRLKKHPTRNQTVDNMGNIRFIISTDSLQNPGYELVHEEKVTNENQNDFYYRRPGESKWTVMAPGQTMKIYENTTPTRFAYFAEKLIVANDEAATAFIEKNEKIDLAHDAFVYESGANTAHPQGEYVSESTRKAYKISSLIYDKPYEVSFKVTSPVDTFVVTALPFYDDWKASVDGAVHETKRANMAFIGLPIQKGEHTIRLYYEPTIFKIGALISAASLIGFIILLTISQKPRKN